MTTSIFPAPTASSALPVGARLGEFEITGVVGEGGFGIVYSAHDSSLDRIVAVKEYLPSAFSCRTSEGLVEVKSEEHRKTFAAGLSSFINEAKMLAKFSHPGLVEVFRFWEGNGTAYMAMRYYRGVTLRQLLRTTPQIVTEQWLCETLDPILLALRELHLEKCYHRDIAPDNILVLPNGRSVLMDFGAARRIIGGMTQALTVVLKPGYAPIEQYYDDGSMQQGSWTDIYAIGGLLYHVMTGKVPVQAISRMMSDPLRPVSELARGHFSPRLCDVVMKCLAVLPVNRYQSVDELRAALGWVTTPGASTVVHSPAPLALSPEAYPATVILKSERDGNAATLATNVPIPSAKMRSAAPQPPTQFDSLATVTSRAAAPVSGQGVSTPGPVPDVDPLATASKKPQTSSVAAPVDAPAEVSPMKQQVPTTKPGSSRDARVIRIAAIVLGVIVLSVLALFLYGRMAERGSAPAGAAPGSIVTPGPGTEINAAAGAAAQPRASSPALEEPAGAIKANASATLEPAATGFVPAQVPPVAANASIPVAGTKSGESESAPTGSVRFELKNGWATVFVDGEQKGTVPPVMTIKLVAGAHEIEFKNPALSTVKRSVEVIPGKTVVVRHSFTK